MSLILISAAIFAFLRQLDPSVSRVVANEWEITSPELVFLTSEELAFVASQWGPVWPRKTPGDFPNGALDAQVNAIGRWLLTGPRVRLQSSEYRVLSVRVMSVGEFGSADTKGLVNVEVVKSEEARVESVLSWIRIQKAVEDRRISVLGIFVPQDTANVKAASLLIVHRHYVLHDEKWVLSHAVVDLR